MYEIKDLLASQNRHEQHSRLPALPVPRMALTPLPSLTGLVAVAVNANTTSRLVGDDWCHVLYFS